MHPWNVSVEEAVALQEQLRAQVQQTNSFDTKDIRTVAGVDVTYREVGHAAVVVFDFLTMQIIEQVTATGTVNFPYVPGLLSFRECPVALQAFEQLHTQPDVIICDGQGYAHPRRFGLACHLGLWLDRPTIGCAKTRFIGTYANLGQNMGDQAQLMDGGEVIGVALRTRANTNPVFVSVGHKIDLDTAAKIVIRCVRGYRLPETTRAADHLSRAIAASADEAKDQL
jgi:deoxyribonuclease V